MTTTAITRPVTALLAAAMFAAACSSGGDKTPSTSPTPAITLSTTSATLDLTQGLNATITVSISRTGGFTGDVTVTVEGLPAGVTASALTIASASSSGNITLTALATAVVAGSNLTIRGSGSGISSATANVALNVRAAAGAAITISTAAPTLDITQAATAVINVTISRTGGFTGDVTVTVEGLPTGVTASALTITSANTTGAITLTALATAVVAGSTLTVRGSGTGVTSVTASVALNVRAAAAGGVSVVFNPSSLTIIQGATVNLTATITRTGGFTGPVTFNVTGLPTGLTVVITATASANQTVVTSNSANFAFTASPSMAVGTSNINITASGTGVTASSVTLVTQVNAATAGTNAVWTFCPAFGIPVGVYVQDGTTAAFTKITAGANNTYTFSIAQSKGAVAYDLSPTANINQLYVFLGTRDEIVAQGTAICANQSQTVKSVGGALVGISGTDQGFVALGTSSAVVTAGSANFTLNNVPNGNLDLIGTRTTLTINGSSFSTALAAIVIRRSLNIGNGFTISPSIDVSPISAEAVAPVNKTLTLTGLNGDQAIVQMLYITPTTSASLLTDFNPTTVATHTIPTVPAAKQQSADYHYAFATAAANLLGTNSVTRQSGTYFFAGADKTLALGPTPSAATISNLNFAAPVRLNAAFTMQLEYNKYFYANFSQSGTPSRNVQVSATSGYIGSATTVNLGIPDLVPAGYPATRGLQPLVSTTVQVGATGWTTPGGIGTSPVVEGATLFSFFRSISYTP